MLILLSCLLDACKYPAKPEGRSENEPLLGFLVVLSFVSRCRARRLHVCVVCAVPRMLYRLFENTPVLQCHTLC